ncbi:glycosyltransferase N-terminal domain-containing protein [Cyclobacterium sp. 1_MG-2023]|uniref:3-deoxy-D-manno-octulosonic acid transferase n=2 Tax=Cyclobacterium TaxID=68288 RepID=UPI0026E49172|nr:glycosyltransferase N-terminal domain-containing protein [Cyclobacterium sp. 1_MG-2023]MDO6438156.1 glycosyltransferase N-terminal domain-containing protein [Cyclobacterium sp. 1_MG-2023]
MRILYNLGMILLDGLMKIGSKRSAKLKLAVDGRKNTFEAVKSFRKASPSPLAWFHVASLGEYLQAKPVIAAFKKEYPLWGVAVSFFSPSGYEQAIKKKQEWVDFMCYLPIDTPHNADRFVDLLSPDMVFFVKYDLWANTIMAIKQRKIPLYLVAASFRKEQVYFSWYGKFFKDILLRFDHIFVQNQVSKELLDHVGVKNISITGDPRFDNVYKTSLSPKLFPEIEQGIVQKVMVLGSVWQEDMNNLIPFINQSKDIQFIVAPHDIDREIIENWQKAITLPSVKYSEYKNQEQPQAWKVLVIDNIGMLSSLYQFAHWAYIGGAMGKGLHNILEPLAFGIPVLHGPLKKVSKFPEAGISRQYGCGFPVKNRSEIISLIAKLSQEADYEKACMAAKKLVGDNLGSADNTMAIIKKER